MPLFCVCGTLDEMTSFNQNETEDQIWIFGKTGRVGGFLRSRNSYCDDNRSEGA